MNWDAFAGRLPMTVRRTWPRRATLTSTSQRHRLSQLYFHSTSSVWLPKRGEHNQAKIICTVQNGLVTGWLRHRRPFQESHISSLKFKLETIIPHTANL